MKLPSRLFKSRHGVFYYRFQFLRQSGRKERRISLHTKSPAVAKAKAIQISAIILRNNISVAEMTSSFNPDDPARQQKAVKELAKLDFKKLHESLIADQLKLKQDQEIVNARREVYAEAINSKLKEKSQDENLIAENVRLKLEIDELQLKYQRHIELTKKFMP